MHRPLCILVLLTKTIVLPALLGAQESASLPEELRRPAQGEALRYPQDTVIGDLGRGTAPEGAYTRVRSVLSALMQGNAVQGLDEARLAEIKQTLNTVQARTWRVGGGREEADGSVSFLFRFVGPGLGAAGEIYLLLTDGAWQVDDVLIEEPEDVRGGSAAYPYDFSPYERFY